MVSRIKRQLVTLLAPYGDSADTIVLTRTRKAHDDTLYQSGGVDFTTILDFSMGVLGRYP
jgi:hypothetical protein